MGITGTLSLYNIRLFKWGGVPTVGQLNVETYRKKLRNDIRWFESVGNLIN